MAYVITDPCVGEKEGSCIDVCPVDCIHPTPEESGYEVADQLYIDPGECIDCGACVEVCPFEAPMPKEYIPGEYLASVERNAGHFVGTAAD
jgi:ferredoxin